MATFKALLANQKNKDHTYTVLIRIIHNRRVKYVSSGVRVPKDHFNSAGTYEKRNWVRQANIDYEKLNETIGKKIQEGIHLNADSKYNTVEAYKMAMKAGKQDNIFVYVNKKLAVWQGLKSISFLRMFKAVFQKIETYQGNRKLTFQEMDYSFFERYHGYLKSIGNGPNTIANNIKRIKTLFQEAVKDRVISPDLIPIYTVKTTLPQTTALTSDEVLRLMELIVVEGTRQFHVRNAFLFAMFCAGINIKNILLMRWKNVKDGRLQYERTKTGKKQDIELIPAALQILTFYKSDKENSEKFIFPFIEDCKNTNEEYIYKKVTTWTTKINRTLAELGKMADIDKRLTTHVNRHTFTTIAYEKGISSDELKDLLTHSNVKITEGYIHRLTTGKKDKALKRVFEK